MSMPMAPGSPMPGPPTHGPARLTRSRAGGIMLAIGGVAMLVTVFALPWESFNEFRFTLWEIRQNIAETPLVRGESASYQVPFFTAAAAGGIALLAGALAAAVGARATNVLATLAGVAASLLAFATPVYYYFRSWGVDDLDFFLEVAGIGYFATYAVSLFLLVGTVVALVGAFRAGRPAGGRPPGPPVPGYQGPPGYQGYPGHQGSPGSYQGNPGSYQGNPAPGHPAPGAYPPPGYPPQPPPGGRPPYQP